MTKLALSSVRDRWLVVVFVVVLVLVLVLVTGLYLMTTHAATPTPSLEPESGSLTGSVSKVGDVSASEGNAVAFGLETTRFPDATNTGYAAAGYTDLTTHAGGWTITTSGTYSGYDVTGTVTISADNVTLEGCNIHGATDGNLVTIIGDNVTLEDCDIHGDGPTTAQAPQNSWVEITGTGSAIKRCNFYWSSGDGVRRDGHDFTIEDSYLHDWVQNPTNDPHIDGITEGSDGSVEGVTIRHNTVLMWSNTGLTNVLSFAAGPGNELTNVIVDDNLLAGGGYVIHGGGDTDYSNISFTNNMFSTQFSASGGEYGLMRNAPIWGTNGAIWQNNAWYDGPNAGQPISPP